MRSATGPVCVSTADAVSGADGPPRASAAARALRPYPVRLMQLRTVVAIDHVTMGGGSGPPKRTLGTVTPPKCPQLATAMPPAASQASTVDLASPPGPGIANEPSSTSEAPSYKRRCLGAVSDLCSPELGAILNRARWALLKSGVQKRDEEADSEFYGPAQPSWEDSERYESLRQLRRPGPLLDMVEEELDGLPAPSITSEHASFVRAMTAAGVNWLHDAEFSLGVSDDLYYRLSGAEERLPLRLEQMVDTAMEKDGLISNAGWCLVRVGDINQCFQEEALEDLLTALHCNLPAGTPLESLANAILNLAEYDARYLTQTWLEPDTDISSAETCIARRQALLGRLDRLLVDRPLTEPDWDSDLDSWVSDAVLGLEEWVSKTFPEKDFPSAAALCAPLKLCLFLLCVHTKAFLPPKHAQTSLSPYMRSFLQLGSGDIPLSSLEYAVDTLSKPDLKPCTELCFIRCKPSRVFLSVSNLKEAIEKAIAIRTTFCLLAGQEARAHASSPLEPKLAWDLLCTTAFPLGLETYGLDEAPDEWVLALGRVAELQRMTLMDKASAVRCETNALAMARSVLQNCIPIEFEEIVTE